MASGVANASASKTRSTFASGPEERVTLRQAGEVDVGKGDGVPGSQLAAGRPVRQGLDRALEVVLGVLGLLERRAIKLPVAEVPGAVGHARRPGLDLDHEQAVVGMDDDDVGLAVVRRSVLPGLGREVDVRVQPRGLGQRGPQSLLDEALRALPHCALPWASGRSPERSSACAPSSTAPGGAVSTALRRAAPKDVAKRPAFARGRHSKVCEVAAGRARTPFGDETFDRGTAALHRNEQGDVDAAPRHHERLPCRTRSR